MHGQVAQLVRVSFPYAKVASLIFGQGTYKKQPMNTSIRGTANQCFSLSLSLPLFLSLSCPFLSFFF